MAKPTGSGSVVVGEDLVDERPGIGTERLPRDRRRRERALDLGKGTVTIRRPEDGAICQGPIQGTMRGGSLQVEGSGAVNCQGGGNFAAPRFECKRDRRGETICNGLNKDGSQYEMGISKAR